MKKMLALLLAFVLCLSLFAACGSETKDTTQSDDKTSSAETEKKDEQSKETDEVSEEEAPTAVTIATCENLVTLDPYTVSNSSGYTCAYMMYDTLVQTGPDGDYLPGLATEWECSEDGLAWTFKLREGVKFQNGEDFTSADVVTSFQRLIDDPTLNLAASYWPCLESVEANGDYEVIIHTSEPFGFALNSFCWTYILPGDTYEEYGEKIWIDQMQCGSGPWILDEWIDGQQIVFNKNPDFWGGDISSYDTVTFKFLLEPSAAIAAHLAGDVDGVSDIPGDMMALYDGAEGITTLDVPGPGTSYYYIGFQCSEESVFHDINVRKAFEYAIDRQLLVDAIFNGAGSVVDGIAIEGAFGYNADGAKVPYDPDLAKQLLEESDYNGEPIVISTHNGNVNGEAVGLAISEMVNAVGFNTTIEVLEPATLSDMRATGEYDVFFVSNAHSCSDPYAHLNMRVMQDAHHSFYVNDELNALIKASNEAVDPVERARLIAEADELIKEEAAPHFVLFQYQKHISYDVGIYGVEYWCKDYSKFRNITYVPGYILGSEA